MGYCATCGGADGLSTAHTCQPARKIELSTMEIAKMIPGAIQKSFTVTLRDQFAMAALTGILVGGWPREEDHAEMCRRVYLLADTILAEREKK